MRHWMYVLILTCSMLAACNQPLQAPNPTPEENPVFTDADIDKAILQVANDLKELIGIEEGNAPEGQILAPLPDSQSDLSTQAVLPNAPGFVYYIKYDSAPIIGVIPYSLYHHNQQTDTQTLIYSGNRHIQSVAGSLDGNFVIVSMRETPFSTSDYELYLFNISDLANPAIFLLTNDTENNINVSMSADASRIVSEEPVAGKTTVVLRTKQPSAGYSSVTLSQANPQRQPSLSANGQFISLVRDLANGSDQIMRFNTVNNGYAGIATSTAVLEYPSISENGNKVLWLQNGTTDVANLRDIAAGTTQNVLSSTSIGHPSLAGDGLFMAYQSGRSIAIKHLVTGQIQTLASSFSRDISFYAPMWQGNSLPKVISFLPEMGARGQVNIATIALVFSKEMKLSSLQPAMTGRVSTKNPVTGIITRRPLVIASVVPYQAGQGYGYIFQPQTSFGYNAVVDWSISTAATDLLGNPLAQRTGSSFSTLREFSVTIPPEQNLTGTVRRSCVIFSCPRFTPFIEQPFAGYMAFSGPRFSHVNVRGFVSFDLGSILPDAQITRATLNLTLRDLLADNPFGEANLGTMALERIKYWSNESLNGFDYNSAPLNCGGVICSIDFFGPPDPIDGPINVLKFVQADWLERDTLANRSQYRLRFANSTPATGGEEQTMLNGYEIPTLTVSYLAP